MWPKTLRFCKYAEKPLELSLRHPPGRAAFDPGVEIERSPHSDQCRCCDTTQMGFRLKFLFGSSKADSDNVWIRVINQRCHLGIFRFGQRSKWRREFSNNLNARELLF